MDYLNNYVLFCSNKDDKSVLKVRYEKLHFNSREKWVAKTDHKLLTGNFWDSLLNFKLGWQASSTINAYISTLNVKIR